MGEGVVGGGCLHVHTLPWPKIHEIVAMLTKFS